MEAFGNSTIVSRVEAFRRIELRQELLTGSSIYLKCNLDDKGINCLLVLENNRFATGNENSYLGSCNDEEVDVYDC